MGRHLTLAALVAMAGCGNDDPGPEFPNGPGRFDAPADFDLSGCEPGAFDGADGAAGIYAYRVDYGDGFPGSGGARFDVLADGFGGALSGRDVDLAWADDDVRFLYRRIEGEPTDTASRSLLLCTRDGDTFGGQFAYCTNTECFVGTVLARKVEPLDEAPAMGLTELGRIKGPDWVGHGLNVRVDGDIAYTVRGVDGLRIVDVRDPAAPVELAHVPVIPPGEPGDPREIYNDVKLVTAQDGRRIALVASSRRGIVPVDVTDPGVPIRGASFGAPGESYPNIHTLAVQGNLAYCADTEIGLEIWDVADPGAPRRLGGFFPATTEENVFLHDLYVEGDRAYLNFWRAGMIVADITDPAAVVSLGAFVGYGESSSHSSWVTTVGGRRIAAHGDEQWGARLRLVDVTEGTAGFLDEVGVLQTRDEVSVHNVMAFGSEVILSHYQDGVRIVDISDPASPRTTAWFHTWPGYDPAYGYSFFEGAIGIDVDRARNRVYVADSHAGLIILQR